MRLLQKLQQATAAEAEEARQGASKTARELNDTTTYLAGVMTELAVSRELVGGEGHGHLPARLSGWLPDQPNA